MTSSDETWVDRLFPLTNSTPRNSQRNYTLATDKAFRNGARFVILEAPVGSGKSAAALTLAQRYGRSHILTPRKALQDQYYADFESLAVLMKGRRAYPCKFHDATHINSILKDIEAGKTPDPVRYTNGRNAAGKPPCRESDDDKENKETFTECMMTGPCPYLYAAEVAEESDHIIHNVHGFLFQAVLFKKFQPRPLLVVDECHDLEGIIRDYRIESKVIKLPPNFNLPRLSTPMDCMIAFDDKRFFPDDTPDEDGLTERDRTMAFFQRFHKNDRYVMSFEVRIDNSVKISFTPIDVSSFLRDEFWPLGEKVLLMSGTIYDKTDYCRRMGIDEREAVFLRVDSEFPLFARPVYMKPEYQVDTSHRCWDENFDDLIDSILTVFGKIKGVKGVIHTPSYSATTQIFEALSEKTTRALMSHDKDNVARRLEEFYDRNDDCVFISPICAQGVDFKGDRARFQIIVRVPFPNAGDAFTNHMMKTDFLWYNMQALRTFGQQLGRINRAPGDQGVTILIDSRFNAFISRNRRLLPKWQLDALITR